MAQCLMAHGAVFNGVYAVVPTTFTCRNGWQGARQRPGQRRDHVFELPDDNQVQPSSPNQPDGMMSESWNYKGYW